MKQHSISTATLMRAVQFSMDWNEQCSMLETLKGRRDLYNLEPILNLAVDEGQHYKVRRAATECAATHNGAFTLNWMRNKAEDRYAPAGQRKLALQALAALQLPNDTLPVLEQVASNAGPWEVRTEAIRLIGKYRNVRSVGLLTVLAHNQHRDVAEASNQALTQLLEANGGRNAVVSKMLQRAEELQEHGNRQAAREVMEVATRLEPYNGKLLYHLARLSAA